MSDLKGVYGRLVETINAHDLDGLAGFFSLTCEVRTPNVTLHGREQVRAFFGQLFGAFPGSLRVEVHNLVVEGSTLVAEYTMSGIFTGPFQLGGKEVRPTGKPFVNPVLELNGFEGDQIVSCRLYADRLAQGIQLGLIPNPAGAAAANP